MDVLDLARAQSLIASGSGRAVRQAARLSLAEMGRAVGVDKSTIYRWETGERHPRGELAVAYADLLRRLMQP